MDIKQLLTGKPKEGFHPVTQDTTVIIELNKAVTTLTNSSTSAEIIAAFDSDNKFTKLLEWGRTRENIIAGILVDDAAEVGKIEASVIFNRTSDVITIDYVYNLVMNHIVVTRSGGNYTCAKTTK